MNSSPGPARRHAWAEILLIATFAALLWLPTVDYFGHVDHAPTPDENRVPAPPPHLRRLNLAGLQGYLAATESYFNDHFGFRHRLIRWCHQWKARLFHAGRSTDQVVVGQNGFLYFTEGQMMDQCLGLAPFTLPQMQAWQRLLETRRDWLAARGIKYIFVIPPDKQTVYPENLPAWLLAARPAGAQSKLNQFLQYMKTHSTVEIVDLRPTLMAGKKMAPTYLQTDSHWNLYGGFLASQIMIQAAARQLPNLPPLRLEDFDWTNAPATGGDLARILDQSRPEKNSFVFTPKPPLTPPRFRQLTNIVRVFNPGDPMKQNWLVENTNPAVPVIDAVVFHDSFGKAFRQFFGYSFHRVVFVWENKEFNAKVIVENHPQIVINEMLERYFNIENPNQILAEEGLP